MLREGFSTGASAALEFLLAGEAPLGRRDFAPGSPAAEVLQQIGERLRMEAREGEDHAA